VSIHERGQRGRDVGLRIRAIKPCRLYQRGDDAPVGGAFVGACEERVFPVQGDRPDGPLDRVGIELEAAIIEEAGEAVPQRQRVADRLGQARAF